MTVVVDSSVVVAAMVDQGVDGTWARTQLKTEHLIGPHHMPAEVANVLRRAVLFGHVSSEVATLGHGDLLQLRVTLFGYRGLAERVWELRANLSAYDAWYVALAEVAGAPLVTLDRRLSQANGPRCDFRVPRSAEVFETGME